MTYLLIYLIGLFLIPMWTTLTYLREKFKGHPQKITGQELWGALCDNRFLTQRNIKAHLFWPLTLVALLGYALWVVIKKLLTRLGKLFMDLINFGR